MLPILFQGFFPTIVNNLQSWGFFLYLFPFLLTLAIVYGVLSFAAKEQLPKSARGLIAIVLAFSMMLYSFWNPGIVQFFANLTGGGLIFFSGLLFVIIFLGLMGVKIRDITWGDNKWAKWISVLVLLFISLIIFLGAGAGSFFTLPSWVSTGEFMTLLFFVFIIAIAVWWLGSDEKGGGGGEHAGEKKH